MRLISIIFVMVLISHISLATAKIVSMNYDTSTVILQTATGDIFGTLTLPRTQEKIPMVIFISGSGPTDRDGNNPLIAGKNNCFLQLSEVMAEKGIASLRFDKRGIGQSKKAGLKESEMRFEDFISDVEKWIEMFRKDDRISKIIVAGHSEGSLIGMIASNNKADKFISIAGPGFPIDQTLKTQLEKQLPDSMRKEVFMDIDSLKAGHLVKRFPLQLLSLFRPSVQPYIISWMKYDPGVELAKLKIPVLILQGGNDIQVTKEDAMSLSKNNPLALLVIIPKMNHVLKEVPVSNPAVHMKTYGDPTLMVSKKMIKQMVRFIKSKS